jgi:hypothetical protein
LDLFVVCTAEFALPGNLRASGHAADPWIFNRFLDFSRFLIFDAWNV